MHRKILTFVTAAAFFGVSFAQTYNLPVELKDGKPYYYYIPGKDESVFGVLSRFNWDENVFRQANPGLVELTKNTKLYYPVPADAEAKIGVKPQDEQQTEPHIGVQDSDDLIKTIPADKVDDFLKNNNESSSVPEQKSEPIIASESTDAPTPVSVASVSADSELILPRPAETIQIAEAPVVVITKDGDTLYSLAREYHTTVADLFALNPRLSYNGLTGNRLIKVLPGSELNYVQTRAVVEKQPDGHSKYKIKKDDTWESIANMHGLTVEQLKETNSSTTTLKEGKSIGIPRYKDVVSESQVLVLDKNETTDEGLEKIYNNVKNNKALAPSDVNVTMIVNVDEAERKRNVEFLRGFMLGVETLRKTPYKVHLKVVEINDDTQIPSILEDEAVMQSDMIISTSDKEFSQDLIRFGEENDIEIVNVFDAKGINYAENSRYIQVLPPSDYLFGTTAKMLAEIMNGRTYLFIGDESNDGEGLRTSLKDILDENVSIVTLPTANDISGYQFDPSREYVIISEESARQPVMELIDIVNSIKTANPELTLSVVGRPTWLVFSDANAAKLQKADTYFPTRFYLDEKEPAVKAFEKRFGAYYKAHTIKSLPAYAAMGYDVARYFINTYAQSGADMNFTSPSSDMLQLDFNLGSPNYWGGLYNRVVYLLNYNPDGSVKKLQP